MEHPDIKVYIHETWPGASEPKGAVTYHRIALTDAERTVNIQKNVYPVVKVVSVAMKVVTECVRSA